MTLAFSVGSAPGSVTDLSGASYGLAVLKGVRQGQADIRLAQIDNPGNHGAVTHGNALKSFHETWDCTVTGSDPDDRQEKMDAVKNLVSSLRGEQWFELHAESLTPIASARRRGFYGRINGPINEHHKGLQVYQFQLNIMGTRG